MQHPFWVSQLKNVLLSACMYVRKKTGQEALVDKSRGQLRYLATMGISSDSDEINMLYNKGLEWINQYGGQIDMFKSAKERQQTEVFSS